MTKAVKLAVKIGFERLKLHRIEANVMPWNAASLRVLEKCGFERVGIAQKYLNINGIWEDHYINQIIREE
jgi:ribosomal-protein-alanine N-acetyltransferase